MMGVLLIAMIFGFIGFSLTQDIILDANIESTKMVMNVLKTFDALYDKFQSTSYQKASTGIKNFDNLPERTKWGYIRTMRSEQFFNDITNDKTPTLYTSIYVTIEVKFWALEYAFIFKLCHQYATTTKEPTGTLADDCLRMSNVMNVFAQENFEPIINRTINVEDGHNEWRLREPMLDIYSKLAPTMKTFFDQRNHSVHDANEYKGVIEKATNFLPNKDYSAYLSITQNDSNIRIQRRIAFLKIFFKWISCGSGYHTYLKINPILPKLDELWPTWLTARSLIERIAADNPDKRHQYCEFGPSNCNIMMYRNIIVDLIRTLKLNEFRSVLNSILFANDGSGMIDDGANLWAQTQVVVEKYVASIEFGTRFCYINLDQTRLWDYRYVLYRYDSLTKYFLKQYTAHEIFVSCKEWKKYDGCQMWRDIKISYIYFFEQMHFSTDDSIIAIFTDPQIKKYFDFA